MLTRLFVDSSFREEFPVEGNEFNAYLHKEHKEAHLVCYDKGCSKMRDKTPGSLHAQRDCVDDDEEKHHIFKWCIRITVNILPQIAGKNRELFFVKQSFKLPHAIAGQAWAYRQRPQTNPCQCFLHESQLRFPYLQPHSSPCQICSMQP